MKFLSKYGGVTFTSRLLIGLFSIGCFSFWQIFFLTDIFAQRKFMAWQIPRSKLQPHIFRMQPWLLVEGVGGLRIKIHDRESKILRLYGKPDFRDYDNIETLTYRTLHFHGYFYLSHGFVKMIRFQVHRKIIEDFYPYTAMGFHLANIKKLNFPEKKEKIKSLYKTKYFLDLGNKLIYYSRGVTYEFNKTGQLIYIDIYAPKRHY